MTEASNNEATECTYKIKSESNCLTFVHKIITESTKEAGP